MRDLKIMFLDSETTGVINMRTPYDDLTVWPHVVQLAYTIALYTPDAGLQVVKKCNYYIKPSGFTITPESFKIHKLSQEFLEANGKSVQEVMTQFIQDFSEVDVCCAHNSIFDMKMIKAEFLRLQIPRHLREIPWIDTMWYGQQFRKFLGKGSKWPKLDELYQDIYHRAPEEILHTADGDVEVLMNIFLGLNKATQKVQGKSPLFSENHILALMKAHSVKPNARPITNSLV